MTHKIYQGKIPFGKNGNQLHHPSDGYWSGGKAEKDNFIFTDSLTYKHYARGRSAAYMIFSRKSTKSDVVVFLKEFQSMVVHMVNGSISGEFTFLKRGQNFGCRYLGPIVEQ